jgi:hypothetical protein
MMEALNSNDGGVDFTYFTRIKLVVFFGERD